MGRPGQITSSAKHCRICDDANASAVGSFTIFCLEALLIT
jgi:hypothetical protein